MGHSNYLETGRSTYHNFLNQVVPSPKLYPNRLRWEELKEAVDHWQMRKERQKKRGVKMERVLYLFFYLHAYNLCR